ncbi:MAG: AraC family transcriptional regulator [Dyadobacter sp.]
MTVKKKLKQLGLHNFTVDLGEVEIEGSLTLQQHDRLKILLLKSGLELMDDKKAMLLERIKNVIVELVHYSEEIPKIKNSEYISGRLNYDYTYLANIFSESEGTTIEHFIISHKVERIKEYILYDELNLTEISYKLNYSSVAHLSSQFKKVTGLSPSVYKQLQINQRKPLEHV